MKIQQQESGPVEVNSSPLHKDSVEVASTSSDEFFPNGIGEDLGLAFMATNSIEEKLVDTETDFQFEADAAAALLKLQRRAASK